MSQSPDVDAAGADESRLVSYRNAWSALSQLIGKGRSFSGHERNCVFLNTGPGAAARAGGRRFADVSAATGLDRPDDGRAVALVDWDFDGDLDLWVANRTAPRVRLLRNDTETGHHWLELRLQGVTSNRDAIGARVEVVLRDDGAREAPRPRYIRTLRAGDGYLAQSSKWVHFGLGTADAIDRVLVAWPGGAKETFTGIAADRHYRLVQGSGSAELWTPPARPAPLAGGPVTLPPRASARRTVITGRVALPESHYASWEGTTLPVDRHRGGKLLLALWSTTCAPCVEELAEWSKNEKALRGAGLSVLALCVDGMTTEDPAQRERADARARQLLARLSFPFASGKALPDLVSNLEIVQRVYLELQEPLPVPCGFLLDERGRTGAIYKGRVALEQLLADAALLDASPEVRRDSAVPFKGRWASQTFPPNPEAIARAFDLAGRPEAAAAYLRRHLETVDPEGDPAAAVAAVRRLGETLLSDGKLDEAAATYGRLLRLAPRDGTLHREIGLLLLLKGRLEEAGRHFAAALEQEPRNAELLYNAGLAEMGLRRPARAADLFRRALAVSPDDVTTHFQLASALLAQGEAADALPYLRRCLEIRPGWPYAANNLAWVLATHPNEGIRDGAEAVRIAEPLCRAGNYADPATLATLAAAYAEAGRFAEAAESNQRAMDIAAEKGQGEVVAQLRERHDLYLAKRPFRDAPKRP